MVSKITQWKPDSSRGNISALSADITQKRHHISTKSVDMTTLSAIADKEAIIWGEK